MRRSSPLLLSWLVLFAPSLVHAQTLDELQHPLVTKGRIVAAGEYEYYAVDHTVGDYAGTFTMSFSRPENVLFPQLRIGLAKNLELGVDGTNQFATLFADPGFAAWSRGGHALYATTIRSAAANVVFRPAGNLELRSFYRWGRTQDTLDYSVDPVTDSHESHTAITHVISARGTWLSAVDEDSQPLRSDLDGLHHALLKARRARIDGEIMRRWYDLTYLASQPESIDDRLRSRDTRIWVGVANGITDHLQVGADIYWHPAFRAAGRSHLEWTYDGKTYSSRTDSSTRYEGVFGWRLAGRWRVNDHAEMFLDGTREQQGIAHDYQSDAGPVDIYRTTTIKLGGTWLSRQPNTSVPVNGDLVGLYHPFVEPKQLKLDASLDHLGYRGDVFVPAVWLWRVQATTGVWSWLQATAYGGMMLVKQTESADTLQHYKSLGARLALRVCGRVEAFGSAHLHPAGFFDDYPLLVLGRDDPYYHYRDVLNNDPGGDRTLHVGLRFVM